MTDGSGSGVLLSSTPHGSWAWVGIRLTPAQSLSEHRGYLDLPEEERRGQAAAAELAWLTAHCLPVPGHRFELRTTADGGLLRCTLLAQVAAATAEAAEAAGLALRERLGRLPAHVRGVPVTDAEELLGELDPLGPSASALLEVRKRLSARPMNRPDSTRRFAVTVSSLGAPGPSWEPFWAELARSPEPAVLSVALEPHQLEPWLLTDLRRFAAEYARLARPAGAGPLWGRPLPGDPAADAARVCFEQALARYATPGYRFRMTLATAGPQLPGLAELLADLVGRGSDGAGGGAVVVAPAPGEEAVARRNLAALNLDPLPVTHRQGLPADHVTPAEQLLTELADRYEAAAAFRLPYEVAGHPPLFDPRYRPTVADQGPDRPPARGGGTLDPHLPVF